MELQQAKRSLRKTIKSRILRITITFSLVVAVVLATVSVAFFRSYARRNVIQSTEFNLQLVSGLISQNFEALNDLANWCTFNDQVLTWLEADDDTNWRTLNTYYSLQSEFYNSRANPYIRRLLVVDAKRTRLIQLAANAMSGEPVSIYNVDRLVDFGTTQATSWQGLQPDPLSPKEQTISLLRPIQDLHSGRVLGYIYLSVSPAMVTDQVRAYHIAQDSHLVVRFPSAAFQIANGALAPSPNAGADWKALDERTMLDRTVVGQATAADGKVSTLVLYPVEAVPGMYMANSLSSQLLQQQLWLYGRLLLIVCGAILLLGVVIAALLDRLINPPVEQLRERLRQIALGDFSAAPDLEWDNEFGDIGRGINQLSHSVADLMHRRVADEKKRKDLEYQMLQSQVNPHFLYNTLNLIKWMATIQGVSGIAEMTTSLARLLKNISKNVQKVLPLSQELSLLDDYFVIQKYRYGGAITLTKEIEPGVEDCAILRFTLQPLLENAIFHGIEPKGGAGSITLKARRLQSGEVEVSMTDDGVGMSQKTIDRVLSGSGPAADGMFRKLGLHNVQQRLQYDFGEPYGLTIASEEGVYTTMTILLPGKAAADFQTGEA